MGWLQVVEWAQGEADEIVRRVPADGGGEFRLGSQLIVREHQTALFYRNGRVLDAFGPGRYTLETDNLPLLSGLLSLPFGSGGPFRTEVYFVSRQRFLDLRWGTPQPVPLRDSELGRVRLRAFGSFALRVADPERLLDRLAAGRSSYTTADVLGYLRGALVSRFAELLGESAIGLYDLPAAYGELAERLRDRLRVDVDPVGLELEDIHIHNISPTEETLRAIDERAARGAGGATPGEGAIRAVDPPALAALPADEPDPS
jgi:membrane protease subunit (stomatin/prohibitin family)